MRALILDPPILFLDEPLGALDPIVRRGLQDDLRAIFRQLKKTVVIVTHDLHEADFFGDTVTLLNQGRVEDPKSEYATAYFNAQRGSGQ